MEENTNELKLSHARLISKGIPLIGRTKLVWVEKVVSKSCYLTNEMQIMQHREN